LARRRLIVGLGNPGADYVYTRHNIGFVVVDTLADKIGADPFQHGRGNVLEAMGRIRGRNIVLAKPLTYMNRSGGAVKALLGGNGLQPEDMLVVYDDIALPVGKLRLRKSGSAGGHNGVQDIIDVLGTDVFPRLRFGIGNDFSRGRQADYVLSPFDSSEDDDVDEGVVRALDAISAFVTEGLVTAMNRFN